jgi:hypothetical protein
MDARGLIRRSAALLWAGGAGARADADVGQGLWIKRQWLHLGLIHGLPALLSLLVVLLGHSLPAIALLSTLLALGLLAVPLGEYPRASQ